MTSNPIKSAKQLRRAVANGCHEFRLWLQGGLYSRKSVTLCARGRFHIVNHIDETEETLTARQLYTHSNIGRAMRKGAFIASP